MKNTKFFLGTFMITAFVFGCQMSKKQTELSFKSQVVSDSVKLWWARGLGDINSDGLLDVAISDNNAYGGWLGWLEANNTGAPWNLHIIADTAPNGGKFSAGDLEVGDIDGDGDIDVLGIQHTGEWVKATDTTTIYWYSNPNWEATKIGTLANFLKDVSLADFDNDGKLDLVAISFKPAHTMVIYRQDAPDMWTLVQEMKITNLHEGMDVGDIDGDGDIDIVANGYWLENPGGNLTAEWNLYSIDEKWHNQELNHWSADATKGFCRDINGDGKVEVFISHSEKSGYPLCWYESADPKKGEWTEHVLIDNFPSAHTIQVFDFDNDGDYDVLTGINRITAGKNWGVTDFPVYILLNSGDNNIWDTLKLADDGIYNGQAADFDGDGDIDFLRMGTHDTTRIELYINQLK